VLLSSIALQTIPTKANPKMIIVPDDYPMMQVTIRTTEKTRSDDSHIQINRVKALLQGDDNHSQNVSLVKLWTYDTDGMFWSVDVASDGSTVASLFSFIVTSDGSYIDLESSIYFFSAEGFMWKYEVEPTIRIASAALSKTGEYIAIISSDGYVHFLDNEKKLLWRYHLPKYYYFPLLSYIHVTDKGDVITHSGKTVYFLKKNGRLGWKYEMDSLIRDMDVSMIGKIVVGTEKGEVYVFTEDGKLLRDVSLHDMINDVSISYNGEYVAIYTANGTVYLLDKSLSSLWYFTTHVPADRKGDKSFTQVAVSGEGYLAVMFSENVKEGNIYYFRNSGDILWKYKPGWGGSFGISILPQTGNVLGIAGDGNLYLLSNSGLLLQKLHVGPSTFAVSENEHYLVVGRHEGVPKGSNKPPHNSIILFNMNVGNPSATIITYSISSGKFKANDTILANLTVKNTGDVKWTFYVNGSLVDSVSGLYSIDFPHKEITLDPGAIGTVSLEWVVGMSTPAAEYDTKVAIWKDKFDGRLVDVLDVKEKLRALEVVPDGFDYDALEWVNVVEARELIPENEDMSEVLVAVIDTGIDPDVWEYIEERGGDIALYVRIEKYWEWWDVFHLFPKFRYIIANDPQSPNVRDHGLGHGSSVASVIFQVAPKVSIIMFDVADLDRNGRYLGIDFSRVESALQWIVDNMGQYDIDIISMSIGIDRKPSELQDEIKTLYEKYGVNLFASAGNEDRNKYFYPASFDEVISVGGIFDDPDGFLTLASAGKFKTEYSGLRVTESKYKEFRQEFEAIGSTYNDKLDFVAPMFDVEVLWFKRNGNQPGTDDVDVISADGTSFSTPIAVGTAALAFHAYYERFEMEPSPSLIYETLKQTAETYPSIQDTTPRPILNGKVYDVVYKSDYVGWGCVDAYDAVTYIIKMEESIIH